MTALPLTLSFIFGIICGSFLNVVALRFNTGVGLKGRSKCMSCGKSLTWKELVPIFSFMMQGGVCKKCKSKISWQYPLVEIISGIIFFLIFLKFPPVSLLEGTITLIQMISACLLMVIAVYDIKHKIIPNNLVYIFSILSLAILFTGGISWWHIPSYGALLAGPLLALPFALLWLISRGIWMGLGDAKLALGIGWLLGIEGGINAMILSFWIAAALSLIWMFCFYKKFKARVEVPFGPYMILGLYLVLLFGIKIMDISIIKELL